MKTGLFKQSLFLFISSLVGLSVLTGCSTNFLEAGGRQDPNTQAHQHLKLSQESTGLQSLHYRLQAVDHFIVAKNVTEAQRVLRATQINTPQTEPSVRRSILETRLALLKKDFGKARQHLKTALAGLPEPQPISPGSNTSMPMAQGSDLRIALLLPSRGPHAEAAKTVRDGFLAGYYKMKQQRSVNASVKIYDTGDGSNVREAYEKALAENVHMVVGPLTKPEVQAMAKLQNISVPVLALNTVSEDNSLPKKLYQFGLMPEDEVIAIAAQALRQRKQNALIFAPQNEWGKRLGAAFKQYWKSHGGRVVDELYYPPSEALSTKVRDLVQVKGGPRQDADMIFLAATPEAARQIKPLLNHHRAEHLTVYATSAVYGGTPSSNDHDLNGVHFCDMPWVLQHSPELQQTYQMTAKLWPGSSNRSPRFFALGMDAYFLAQQLTAEGLTSNGFSGVTGALRLNDYRRIQRELVCAKFEGGVAVPD